MITKRTLGIFPKYLLQGLPTLQQLVIVHIWDGTLNGDKLNQAKLVKLCSSSPQKVKTAVNTLVELGMLDGTLDELIVNCEFVPNYVLPVEKVKKKKAPPSWVFQAIKLWSIKGAISPSDMFRFLNPSIIAFGETDTLRAFERYAKVGKLPYETVSAFGKVAKSWIDFVNIPTK